MYISMNELKAALRRCFEASGYFVGNYEDAANMILWLEKHGLNGLDELAHSLPFVTADLDKPLSKVIYEDSTSATIDAHGRSALNCVAAAVDLAQAKALESGIATITVHNCHNRMFILKALTDCGRRGISAAAYWQNGSETVTEHTAAIRSGQRYPSYSEAVTNLTSDTEDRQALTIICSSRVDLTSSLQSKEQHYVSPQQIAENKARTVEFGIEISEQLWDQINRLGTGILVENTERSRLDAGGN
jgi:LDH2 family malate/lactate/ureidoglycolate dehydrogenase